MAFLENASPRASFTSSRTGWIARASRCCDPGLLLRLYCAPFVLSLPEPSRCRATFLVPSSISRTARQRRIAVGLGSTTPPISASETALRRVRHRAMTSSGPPSSLYCLRHLEHLQDLAEPLPARPPIRKRNPRLAQRSIPPAKPRHSSPSAKTCACNTPSSEQSREPPPSKATATHTSDSPAPCPGSPR